MLRQKYRGNNAREILHSGSTSLQAHYRGQNRSARFAASFGETVHLMTLQLISTVTTLGRYTFPQEKRTVDIRRSWSITGRCLTTIGVSPWYGWSMFIDA